MAARLAELPDLNAFMLNDGGAAGSGSPLMLRCDLIDEDPAQPRREFDEASLAELAATIAERGVRQPVSVRAHPDVAGRWMLNFGARRLRASKLAGKTEIPAFVDDAADSFDQVIENEQRDGLRPLELALFVQRQLGLGISQAEAARRLGKSRSYITYVCALIDAPEWLLALYRSGTCTGAHELYDLRRLHCIHPRAVERLSAASRSISRADVLALQSELQRRAPMADPAAPIDSALPPPEASGKPAQQMLMPDRSRAKTAGDAPTQRKPLRLSADLDGERVEVDLLAVPADSEHVYERARGGSKRRIFAISRLSALQLSR